jgi:hypothetical protein
MKMNKAEVAEDKEVTGGGMRPYFLYKKLRALWICFFIVYLPNRQQTCTTPEDPLT